MNPYASDPYFNWLIKQVAIVGRTPRTYDGLFAKLFEKEFTWFIPGDDNRMQDAIDLRGFFDESRQSKYPAYVTFLEMLIGISQKLAFIAGGNSDEWAWVLLENLNLEGCCDPLTLLHRGHIDEVIDAVVWRHYQQDGRGGFFPLRYPQEDQTKVEIWKQLHSYVNEIEEPI